MCHYLKLKEILDNKTIILEKCYYNPKEFDLVEQDNNILLIPKPKEIKICKIDGMNNFPHDVKTFRHCKIVSCKIENKYPTDFKFNSILKDIYYLIGDGSMIIKKSILDIKTGKLTDKGFQYLEKLSISYQRKEAGVIFKEIINQCLCNKIQLQVEIDFKSGEKCEFII